MTHPRPRRPRLLDLLGATALALAAGCATSGAARSAAPGPAVAATPAERPPDIVFEPEEVHVTALDLALADKNDEELFAVGTAAYAAGDFPRAAAAFARIVDRFPGSRHEAAALFNAGLAYERLESWRLGLERFRDLARRYTGPDALEASFKAAECLFHLRELDDTHAALAAVAARADLSPSDRIRAQTLLGVVEAEQGKLEQAEVTLKKAVGLWQAVGDRERLDPYFPAQAQYYLGELYREWFRALPLDPSAGDDAKLKEDLEHKSEMLLSAQAHYLRAVRVGDHSWAVASGFRIGELYDELRRQMLEAPLPPGFDDEHARAYRAELRARVRILATKAMSAYDAALSLASRTGVEGLQVLTDAQAALLRLKNALAGDAGQSM
jgi:tetratricopeptide (TPR) repeat protein